MLLELLLQDKLRNTIGQAHRNAFMMLVVWTQMNLERCDSSITPCCLPVLKICQLTDGFSHISVTLHGFRRVAFICLCYWYRHFMSFLLNYLSNVWRNYWLFYINSCIISTWGWWCLIWDKRKSLKLKIRNKCRVTALKWASSYRCFISALF